MRGEDRTSGALFSYVEVEARIAANHPLRAMRRLTNAALTELDARFSALYQGIGRPSIPPERLLRAVLLQLLYSLRSERQLVERLEFDMLFRWFVGLSIDEKVFDASTFSKNRDRLLTHEIAQEFLSSLLGLPEVKGLLSAEHFSVDGTMLKAWASMKSFRPLATGTAEREAAAAFSQRLAKGATLGADKGYDAEAFVEGLKARGIEPHVAINGTVSKHGKARNTAVPSEVAASVRYAISQRLRKRIEEGFGWTKTVGGLAQVKMRGLAKVRAAFVFAMAAYNIVRLPKLLAPTGQVRPAT
jgi:transposase